MEKEKSGAGLLPESLAERQYDGEEAGDDREIAEKGPSDKRQFFAPFRDEGKPLEDGKAREGFPCPLSLLIFYCPR